MVVDDAALLRHVKATWPDGSTVETVRSSVIDQVLANPVLPTGELVPGVDLRSGSPTLSVRQTPVQVDRLMEAWQGGEALPEAVQVELARALLGEDAPAVAS